MSKKHRRRGRPPRDYRIRVRTVRRDPIDYDALARAVLEQAAFDEHQQNETEQTNHVPTGKRKPVTTAEDPRHDRMA